LMVAQHRLGAIKRILVQNQGADSIPPK